MQRKIMVLHGPNLNRLGNREPSIYGTRKLTDINKLLEEKASDHGVTLEILQSNSEAALIDQIQKAPDLKCEFLVINPAAFTHTSIALRDAISSVNIRFIEIHLSNIHSRESFRHKSFFSDLAEGVICGLGDYGYEVALEYAINQLKMK